MFYLLEYILHFFYCFFLVLNLLLLSVCNCQLQLMTTYDMSYAVTISATHLQKFSKAFVLIPQFVYFVHRLSTLLHRSTQVGHFLKSFAPF